MVSEEQSVRLDQALGIRNSAQLFSKLNRIDDVATIARQGNASSRVSVSDELRLGVLAGESSDAHNRHFQAMQQNQAHLQQYFQPVGD